ncbi:MAG: type II toxin-antitoxin system ParD family antitoxin [Kordiimonas sp.]|nr:type II toxin-antitoxin system ParD family antitoxin [Kordiimonas sp.]
MHISLTPKLEEMVRNKVDSGLYNNASEVIRAALRLMANEDKEHEERLNTLRAEIKKGQDSIARGEYTAINSKEELTKFLDEIPDAEDDE